MDDLKRFLHVYADDDDYDITESTTVERPDLDQGASTSEATAAQSGDAMDDDDLEMDIESEDRNQGAEAGADEESGDGVTSEGEKPGTSSSSTPVGGDD